MPTYPNPIPSGTTLQEQWQSSQPGSPPVLPSSWTATIMLSPFGDSIAPLKNYSQIVVGTVEYHHSQSLHYMRTRLFNTVDLTYFDFVFLTYVQSMNIQWSAWYWIDSTPDGTVRNTFGPFMDTTLRVPSPHFMANDGAQWGNTYPLMGIACDHWVVPTPGPADHGSWYTFRNDTGGLFRVFMMDSTNPLMIPILGSYYICSVPTFSAGPPSEATSALVDRILRKEGLTQTPYWNPMVTQEDIQRAMAQPLASAPCTLADIQGVVPGFVPMPQGVPLPSWSTQTYIEGWTLGTDFIPYWTQVCYLWTGDAQSKQQSVFCGLGLNAGLGTYFQRSDTCLDTVGTTQPYWIDQGSGWVFNQCQPPLPGIGLPYPDWLTRDGGVVMAQITGNPNFGLFPGQSINLIAASLPRGGGELAIFWLWFYQNGNGVLFTEGNYMNPLSHNLQLIDYTLFVQNAGITQSAFETTPCGWMSVKAPGEGRGASASGHPTRTGRVLR